MKKPNELTPGSRDEATYKDLYSPARKTLIMKEPNQLTIGARVRRERFLRKLTLEQLAIILGVSASYLGSIERGTRPVSRQMMDRLHEKLNLSYDYMLEGLSLSGSMVSQFVKESSSYTTHHNLNVLLNVCSSEELEACYQLIHTYLRHLKSSQASSNNKSSLTATSRDLH